MSSTHENLLVLILPLAAALLLAIAHVVQRRKVVERFSPYDEDAEDAEDAGHASHSAPETEDSGSDSRVVRDDM